MWKKTPTFGVCPLFHRLSALDKLYKNNFGRIYLSGRSQSTLNIYIYIYKRRATDLDDFIGCGCDDGDVWDSGDDDDDDDQDNVLPGVTQVSQNVACTTLA